MIPESFIQDLLARVDIVDVVGRYVQLRKGGVNLLGLCPFHQEKTPSFTVSPSKQFYHCFGCGAHGTALTFLVEHTGASFPEAVRTLANNVGLAMPQESVSPQQQAAIQQQRAQTTRQQQWLQAAHAHYLALLQSAPAAQQYLKRRGLSSQVIEAFGIGWSGTDSRGLSRIFPQYEDPDLLDSGLVVDGKNGQRYDRFRARIIFPIRSDRGVLIGFGGRLIAQGEPKYLNSPETPLFSKGTQLYGLWEARQAIRTAACVLVVEGYMDVVSLAQHGVTHAVATLGTATTPHHIQKLLRVSDRIVFSFDGDKAGRSAAWRALTTCLPLLRDDIAIRFLFLPSGYDPDAYVQEFGATGFESLVDGALPLSRFLLDTLTAQHPMHEVEGRAACVAQAQPLLAQIPPGALRIQIEHELARATQLTPEELAHTLQLSAQQRAPHPATATQPARHSVAAPRSTPPIRPRPTRPGRADRRTVVPLAKRLLRLLLLHPTLASGLDAAQCELVRQHPHLKLVYALLSLIRASGAQHVGALLQAVNTHTEHDSTADELDLREMIKSLGVQALHDAPLPDPHAEWKDALRRLELDLAKEEQTALIASGLGDEESIQRYYVLKARITQLEVVPTLAI